MDSTMYNMPWVFTDPEAAAELTVNHLLQLGHKHIAKVISRKRVDDVAKRLIKKLAARFI